MASTQKKTDRYSFRQTTEETINDSTVNYFPSGYRILDNKYCNFYGSIELMSSSPSTGNSISGLSNFILYTFSVKCPLSFKKIMNLNYSVILKDNEVPNGNTTYTHHGNFLIGELCQNGIANNSNISLALYMNKSWYDSIKKQDVGDILAIVYNITLLI